MTTTQSSVLEGIILRQKGEYYQFFRVNGMASHGKVQVQIAECYSYPENINTLIWSNFEAVKKEDINIFGELIKLY